ncbi:MAG: hypothetical protein AB1921_08760 [Thermodesulfobacteriota bacterium]
MEKTLEKNGTGEQRPAVADMAPLIHRIRQLATQEKARTLPPPLSPEELAQRFSFAGRRQGKPEVILSEDVFVELGPPREASRGIVLLTFDPGLVVPGRIRLSGPDLSAMHQGESRSFGQVVMLSIDPENIPDPFDLDNTQYLMHRISGYMVRSIPGRLWVRVSKAGRKNGLTLHAIGSALIAAYTRDFPGVRAAEVLFVTGDAGQVEELSQVSVEAGILSGQHKKLALNMDGSVECTDLSCDTCDEKPVCDNLRDVVVKRRKRAGGQAETD